VPYADAVAARKVPSVEFVVPSCQTSYDIESPLFSVESSLRCTDSVSDGRIVARAAVFVWDGLFPDGIHALAAAADVYSSDVLNIVTLMLEHVDVLDELVCVDDFGAARRVALIDEVFVAPDVRGRGLGAKAVAVALHGAGLTISEQVVVAAMAGSREETGRARSKAAAAGILETLGLVRVGTTDLYVGDTGAVSFADAWLAVLDSVWEGRTGLGT
jgi:GNAT superfamily N-acetyltransferase